MSAILVTGGTGTLGRALVPLVTATGHRVRVLSRRPQPAGAEPGSWVTGDLRRGEGLAAAVAGVEVIVHCATSLTGGDTAATENLISAARATGSPHLVYISIVGIDRVPLGYYRAKLATERLIEDSGLPWTVLRATQFHDLILRLFTAQTRLPLLLVPAGFRFQPVEVSEVAARLAELAARPPAGRVPDLGGPQIRTVGDLARSYLRSTGRRRVLLPVPLPGAAAAAFRRGGHLAPDYAAGRVTFEQFLARQSAMGSGEADGQRLVRPGARPHPSKRLPGSHLGDVLLPRLQPASVQGLAEAPATGTFADVARARHQLVVTFRRDGSPVATTVWAAPAEGRLYIRTERASGKVKRLRRHPRALIAPSTARGRPLGPPMPVTGRVLAADDEVRAEQALASSNGWYRALFENSADQLRVDMCYLELTPQPQVADVPPAAGTEA